MCVEAASEVLVCCVEEAWEARLVGGGLGPGGRVPTRRGTLAGTQAAAAALGGRTRGGGSRVACWRFGSWDGASFRTACKGLSDGAAAAGGPREVPLSGTRTWSCPRGNQPCCPGLAALTGPAPWSPGCELSRLGAEAQHPSRAGTGSQHPPRGPGGHGAPLSCCLPLLCPPPAI